MYDIRRVKTTIVRIHLTRHKGIKHVGKKKGWYYNMITKVTDKSIWVNEKSIVFRGSYEEIIVEFLLFFV